MKAGRYNVSDFPIKRTTRNTVHVNSAGEVVRTRHVDGTGSALLLRMVGSVVPAGATTPPVTAKRKGGEA